MDSSWIPADGPDAVLARVARRMRLRYSRIHVARAIASHDRPNSLLALVEAGPGLGLKVTPGKTDASELEDLSDLVIVHFTGAGDAGGFGVLEGSTPEGFRVWDSHRGSRLLDRDSFLERWSGIIALVERGETKGAPEPAYLRNRILELFFNSIDPPALLGSRAAPALRVGFGFLFSALLALALIAAPAEDRLPAAALIILSCIGLAVTIVAGISIAAQNSPFADRICARGKYVDCHSVLSSRYSRFIGIPLSDIGISLFGAVLLLIATSALTVDQVAVWVVVGSVYAATVPISLILVGVQVAMRQLCTLCLAVHTVNLASAAIAWWWLRPIGWAGVEVTAASLLLAVYFFLLLLFAIPYFRKHQGLAMLAGMHRRISGSPFASLAEILTEPPNELVPTDCAVALEGPSARHELTIFVHPSCGKCDSVFGEVRAFVEAGLVKAYVGLAPKDPEEADRHACSAVVGAGLSLGAGRMADAYAAAKKNLRAMMTADPVQILASELSASPDSIERSVSEARRRVDRGEAFVDAHAEGTPAVFIDGRLFRGELSHLAFLLQQHPELLEPILTKPARPARDAREMSQT